MRNNFDNILEQSYDNFLNKTIIPLSKDEFVHKIETDVEFSKKWRTKITNREAKYIERYSHWFANNYETGMEWNPQIIPNFDNPYYEPTPKTIFEICYGKIMGSKFF